MLCAKGSCVYINNLNSFVQINTVLRAYLKEGCGEMPYTIHSYSFLNNFVVIFQCNRTQLPI